MAGRKPTAKRALPGSFSQKSTKSGGGKVIKKGTTTTKPKGNVSKNSGGSVKGVKPGTTFKPTTVLTVKKPKK
jgi:hypothetical protein